MPVTGQGYLRAYDAERAQRIAAIKAGRPKVRNLDHGPPREQSGTCWAVAETRGKLQRELTAHLRTGRSRRKPQPGGAKRTTLGNTEDIRISARPSEAEDRAVPGHREGDLLLGVTGKGAVITLVERSSRFVLLAPLPGRHTAGTARQSLAKLIATLPAELRKSITWDRSNENTNGPLRQYWPKGADLRGLTPTECERVALKLNTRPRKTP